MDYLYKTIMHSLKHKAKYFDNFCENLTCIYSYVEDSIKAILRNALRNESKENFLNEILFKNWNCEGRRITHGLHRQHI